MTRRRVSWPRPTAAPTAWWPQRGGRRATPRVSAELRPGLLPRHRQGDGCDPALADLHAVNVEDDGAALAESAPVIGALHADLVLSRRQGRVRHSRPMPPNRIWLLPRMSTGRPATSGSIHSASSAS